MDHTITIATRQAPIDTLEPPTMGTLYRWECSCGKSQMTWHSTKDDAASGCVPHFWEAAAQTGQVPLIVD